MDWACLGQFDAEPVFCRLLDDIKGGFFSIQPRDSFTAERAYLSETNVLRTAFRTRQGEAAVTDFMPVGRISTAAVHDYVSLAAPFWLVRRVEGIRGAVPLRIDYRPTIAFARRSATVSAFGEMLVADTPVWLWSEDSSGLSWEIDQGGARTSLELRAGDCRHFVVGWQPPAVPLKGSLLQQLFEVTQAFWREWSSYCRYQGPYRGLVLRSALALKALTYAPSGAIVAAPTTSLPEQIGGARNWDYRFCWLRDSTFMLYALGALGYSGEARRFAQFLVKSCQASHPRLQILYGISSEPALRERPLDHLAGYRHSRPVRVGNGAYRQQQLDVYGEVLDWAYLYRSLGGRLSADARRFLQSLESFLAVHWHEPDQGLWESRGTARPYVLGKVMCWVGIDRLIRLFGATPQRLQLRDTILRVLQERGIDPESGVWVQAFGERHVDASLLLIDSLGVPVGREASAQTLETVNRLLRHGDYVYRYLSQDGLPGDEAPFLICSFWLVDALLFQDRGDEARELFERLLGAANDVGLYAEELDPKTGDFLGNFPQALTHLGLIESAVNLELYRERGVEALRGSHADRARHTVEAIAGPRALWTAFKQSRRLGRLWSSRASRFSGRLPWQEPG